VQLMHVQAHHGVGSAAGRSSTGGAAATRPSDYAGRRRNQRDSIPDTGTRSDGGALGSSDSCNNAGSADAWLSAEGEYGESVAQAALQRHRSLLAQSARRTRQSARIARSDVASIAAQLVTQRKRGSDASLSSRVEAEAAAAAAARLERALQDEEAGTGSPSQRTVDAVMGMLGVGGEGVRDECATVHVLAIPLPCTV
jgi:hypothetical protein